MAEPASPVPADAQQVRDALDLEPGAGRATEPVAADLGFRLRSLIEFVSLVSAARGYADLVRVMAAEGRKALEASTVSLSVWERDRGRMRTLVNHGDLGPDEQEEPADEAYQLSDHPLARRMFTEGVGYVQSVDDPLGNDRVRRILLADAKHSCLAVPIRYEGRVWGELWATRTADLPPFTDDDLAFAQVVSAQVGAGIAQAEHLARVERLAYTDDLTGLANRRAFEDRLDEALALHRTTGVPVGIVVLDVNGLKRINDRHGHAVGDTSLLTFASELAVSASALPDTLAARLGGDEFCVLVVGESGDSVVSLANDMCRRATAVLDEGVACGVASTDDLPTAAVTPSRLLRAADAAQYRAKRARLSVPVVAGRVVTDIGADVDADPGAVAPGARRRFRGRGALGPGPVLDEVLRRLDAAVEHEPLPRLVVVATTLAEVLDASCWFVSQLVAGSSTVVTRRSAVSRSGDGEAYYTVDEYPLDDYPATYAALTGQCVVVDVDDPRRDPAETSLLMLGAVSEMIMSGGSDADGDQWVVEIAGDDLSAPVRPYASVLRAAVALALRR
jgi:diguanylate cyclase (GGDEF)-like protein